MGIDPAPFWANLFLYQYEHRYMKRIDYKLTRSKLDTFIPPSVLLMTSVLLMMGTFSTRYIEIYTQKNWNLKRSTQDSHGTFLKP